jgi:hypothetical protein
MNVLKNDIGEFDEAMFQGVESQFEIIFCILGMEKATLMKSLKCCFD